MYLPIDLPPPPLCSGIFKNRVYWIGSVWNNEYNQGNIDTISHTIEVLRDRNISFIVRSPVTTKTAISLIRHSLFAPALAGQWQVDNGYLPCRMFKNISYGRLGLSNVHEFIKIYDKDFVYANSFEGLLEKYLLMNKRDILDMTHEQQRITKNHTYFTKMKNIFDLM